MTVISLRAQEKRRDRRREIDMLLEYNGQEFRIADCSLGGLVIEGGCAVFPADSDVKANLKTASGEITGCQDISLKVVRNDPEADRVAFNFMGLGDACFTALERHLTGRGNR
jgi:hypothetical protein